MNKSVRTIDRYRSDLLILLLVLFLLLKIRILKVLLFKKKNKFRTGLQFIYILNIIKSYFYSSSNSNKHNITKSLYKLNNLSSLTEKKLNEIPENKHWIKFKKNEKCK